MTNNQKKKSPKLLKNKNHVKKKIMSNLKQRKRKNKMKKKELDEFPCAKAHGHFCLLSSHIFSFQFSLQFGKKTFWLVRGENTWAPPFIFLSLYPTKHIPKSFPPHFLSKVFYPPYFTFKQTDPKGHAWRDSEWIWAKDDLLIYKKAICLLLASEQVILGSTSPLLSQVTLNHII